MTWIKVNFNEIKEFKWAEVEMFTICEIYKNGAKIAQINPYNLLSADSKELHQYDSRWDGKRYFCSGFHDNGYTPLNVVGTCKGSYNDFLEIIDAIWDCKDDFERI